MDAGSPPIIKLTLWCLLGERGQAFGCMGEESETGTEMGLGFLPPICLVHMPGNLIAIPTLSSQWI